MAHMASHTRQVRHSCGSKAIQRLQAIAGSENLQALIDQRTLQHFEQALIVVQMAKTHRRLFGGTENFIVTRQMRDIATREEKLALLDCLFAVSAADDSITTVESNVIRQIADELLLEHADYIEVRTRFRDHLAVLRRPQSPDPG